VGGLAHNEAVVSSEKGWRVAPRGRAGHGGLR